MFVITYKGHSIIAMSLLPIDKTTLRFVVSVLCMFSVCFVSVLCLLEKYFITIKFLSDKILMLIK
jgi:hypothetical protein